MSQGHHQSRSTNPTAERWRRYVRLIVRRWWIPLILVSAMVCYRAYKLRQLPDEYVSSAKLVLQGRIQLDKASSYQEEMTNLFGTQKEILLSRQLKLRVQDRMKLLHAEVKKGPVQLQINRDSYSAVINIKARGPQALYCQAYLNNVLDQYMAIRSEMRTKVSNQTLSAINEQLQRLTDQMKEEEDAVTRYHKENDIVVLQEGKNTAAAYLAELVDKRADLQTRLNFLRKLDIEQDINRRSQMTGSSKSTGESKFGNLAESERDFLTAKREIAMLGVEKDRLSKILKPLHPKMRELDSRIAQSNSLLGVFRQQSEILNQQRARSLEVELANLEQEVTTWEKATLDSSRKLAESQRLTDGLDRTRNLHEKLLLSMHEVDQARNLDQDTFSIMERASSPAKVQHSSTKPLLSAAMLGLMAGAGILVLINRFDDTLHSSGEYLERFNHTLLGAIPEIPESQSTTPLEPDDERSLFAEAYRKLRSSLLYKKWENGPPKTLLVTSTIPFDGKSTMASNLATVLAMSGPKVLLIDADLRRGGLHKRFGVEVTPGLADVLLGRNTISEAIVKSNRANLDILPRGRATTDTVEAILREGTREMFEELERLYDYIVVDSAPVLVADDTLSLAPLVDTTLFVIRLSRTPGRLAQRALNALQQRQVPVGGVVLNFDESYSGEYYAYDYSRYYTKLADT